MCIRDRPDAALARGDRRCGCGKFFWRGQAVVAPGFTPGGRWRRRRPGCAGDKPRRYSQAAGNRPMPEIVATPDATRARGDRRCGCGKFFWRGQALVAPGFMPGGRWRRRRPGCAGDKPRRYSQAAGNRPMPEIVATPSLPAQRVYRQRCRSPALEFQPLCAPRVRRQLPAGGPDRGKSTSRVYFGDQTGPLP